MQPEEKIAARLKPGCICMGIKLHRIMDAIARGAATFEEIACLTGIGQGDCSGKRCGKMIAMLLEGRAAEHGNNPNHETETMTTQPIIHRMVTGSYQVNTYIVACPQTREGIIIDPGGNAEAILELVRKNRIETKYIFNTHGHGDHILANKVLKKKLGLKVCIHGADNAFFTRPEILAKERKELGLSSPAEADILLRDGERLPIGELAVEVLHTAGHSPGSACFLISGNLFTGDTLFVGDIGRSDLAGGSFATLLNSIRNKIIPLSPETQVWPGHDYGETPTSTLAWEMKENPYITDFILAEEE